VYEILVPQDHTTAKFLSVLDYFTRSPPTYAAEREATLKFLGSCDIYHILRHSEGLGSG